MKKIVALTIIILPLFLSGQTVNVIRQDTIKHIAKGNDTKLYHEGNSYKFNTQKDSFSFNKPVVIEGEKIENFYQPLDSITLKVNTNTNNYSGKITYDTTNKLGQFNFFDKNTETIGQPMYELWVPPSCYNGTGSTITNGSVVYIDTTEQDYPSIELADNRYYDKSRIIGVVTHDIEPATFGTVTNYGDINDMPDMSSRESNIAYLGQNGLIVYTRPTGGKYPIRIGYVRNDTTLFVSICTSEYTDEVVKAFGFSDYSNTYTTLSFDNSTRYFKISAVGSDFYHYQDGVKNIDVADSVQINATEGLSTIYYDNDTLKYIYGANDSELRDIYRNKVIVSRVYWDATNSQALHIGNQRHTFHIDPYQLEWENFAFGAMYASGIDITDITTDGDGDYDTVAQFNIGSGGFYNEDIFITTPSISRGDNFPIYYWSGVPNVPRRIYEPGFPVLTDITAGVGSTGRLVYNDVTTGTLVTATNNYYVFCHLFALADVTDSLKIISVVGESQYSNKTNAENAALVEGKQIAQGSIPGREGKLLYTFIYETSDGFANGVKARIVSTIDGDGITVDYLDWRKSIIGSGGTGGGSTSFLDLTDSPSSYSGEAESLVAVNSGEDALEFIPNVYKDSTGIVSVVDNSEFIDILIDTIETHQIRNIGTDDFTIRTNFATGWIEQGTGLDNDYDFKMYYDNDYNEAFSFGLGYEGDASHAYYYSNNGYLDIKNTRTRWFTGSYPYDTVAIADSTEFTIKSNLRVDTDDTLYLGSKLDSDASYIIKPSDFDGYTLWKSKSTTDNIMFGGDGGGISLSSLALTLYGQSEFRLTTSSGSIDFETDMIKFYPETGDQVGYLNGSTGKLSMIEIEADTAHIEDLKADTAIIDTLYAYKALFDTVYADTIHVVEIETDTISIDKKAEFNGEIELNWYQETYASSKTIDFTDGNSANRYITLTGGATINVTLPYGTSTLEIVQDASGSHTVTIGTGWGTKWNTLDFDTGTNASTVVQFIKSPTGTKYFISINQN